MKPISIHLPDEQTTSLFGAALAPILKSGDIILLQGPLGAGKTTLARGLIKAFGGGGEAPSPTFTLVEIYDGESAALWHFDFYRLEKPDDVWELGLEEALESGIVLAEWPERVGNLLPSCCLHLTLSISKEGRQLAIDAPQQWCDRLNAGGVI